MNFFEAQAKARKHTSSYVFLFIITIGLLIVLANLTLLLGIALTETESFDQALKIFLSKATPKTWMISSSIVLGIVFVGSLYMFMELSSGGSAVASSLGGKLINTNTDDPQKKQLLNVVEEMALASGMAVPPVYLLSSKSINAFAAGHNLDDVAIGVTQGLVDLLTRDELQGVIAHEFSHIFNGDMRINMRLAGTLHGILLIGLIGEMVMRGFSRGGHTTTHRKSNSKESTGGFMAAVIVVGVSFYLIGFVGKFMGGWIKAIISRKREYLADATAVQYTRYPDGIAGALKKIGGSAYGSKVESSASSTYSHIFFANSISGFFTSMFATHPPLDDRIRAIDARWDGEYEYTSAKKVQREVEEETLKRKEKREKFTSTVLTAAAAMGTIAKPEDKHLYFVKSFKNRLSQTLEDSIHDPLGAQAVMLALLADKEPKLLDRQVSLLSPALNKELITAIAEIKKLKREDYIEVIRLSLPTLKELSNKQYRDFKAYMKHFIEVDKKVSLFEWSLQNMLLRPLDRFYMHYNAVKMVHSSIGAVKAELETIFSMLAQTQYKDEKKAEVAFTKVMKEKTLPVLKYVAKKEITFSNFNAAMVAIQTCKLPIKKRILEVTLAMMMVDEKLTHTEIEMISAVAEVLQLPLPPIQA
jgi:Zn-dependent protease with chaperone function